MTMNMNKLLKIETLLEMSKIISKQSTCYRRKVGCIITDENFIQLSTGYNGVPKGFKHCDDPSNIKYCPSINSLSGVDLHGCYAVHAEQNALLQCPDVNKARYMAVTTSPCVHCAKMIANTGIKTIFFIDDYKDTNAAFIFENAGIKLFTLESYKEFLLNLEAGELK